MKLPRLWQTVHCQPSTVNRKGFTLIELLVVIGIMATVGALTIPSFRSFSQRQSLDVAANQIVSDIEKTRSNALSGRKGGFCALSGTLGGWVIGFKASDDNGFYYKIYAECYSSAGVWGDKFDQTIYLPRDITDVFITINGKYFSDRVKSYGAFLFWTNGGGPDLTGKTKPIPPPGSVSMFGFFDNVSDSAQGGVLTPQTPDYASKACIKLTATNTEKVKYVLFDAKGTPYVSDSAVSGFGCIT